MCRKQVAQVKIYSFEDVPIQFKTLKCVSSVEQRSNYDYASFNDDNQMRSVLEALGSKPRKPCSIGKDVQMQLSKKGVAGGTRQSFL